LSTRPAYSRTRRSGAPSRASWRQRATGVRPRRIRPRERPVPWPNSMRLMCNHYNAEHATRTICTLLHATQRTCNTQATARGAEHARSRPYDVRKRARQTRDRSPLPHLLRDWARRCHICSGTGLVAAASAPGMGSSLPHLRRDWARRCHIFAGTRSCQNMLQHGRACKGMLEFFELRSGHTSHGAPLPS
jgi:hypothetical protein